MSSAIVVEAFALVGWWGLGRLWHRLAGHGDRSEQRPSAIMDR
jgi:hypothetical protein